MDIIQWCNYNEGFVSAILSVLTLLISMIAIYISIKLAYIPYKKRIFINPVFGMKEDKYYLELTIANSGNRLIGINYITLNYRKTYIGQCSEQKFIESSKTEKFIIDMNLSYEETKFDNDPKIEIEICDTERETYKYTEGLAMG